MDRGTKIKYHICFMDRGTKIEYHICFVYGFYINEVTARKFKYAIKYVKISLKMSVEVLQSVLRS